MRIEKGEEEIQLINPLINTSLNLKDLLIHYYQGPFYIIISLVQVKFHKYYFLPRMGHRVNYF